MVGSERCRRAMAGLGSVNKAMAGEPMDLAAKVPAPTTPPSEDAKATSLVEPTVRTNFADTALWVGALTTDENGQRAVFA